jgi:hypothetical protein
MFSIVNNLNVVFIRLNFDPFLLSTWGFRSQFRNFTISFSQILIIKYLLNILIILKSILVSWSMKLPCFYNLIHLNSSMLKIYTLEFISIFLNWILMVVSIAIFQIIRLSFQLKFSTFGHWNPIIWFDRIFYVQIIGDNFIFWLILELFLHLTVMNFL